jgi:hypothetical protein
VTLPDISDQDRQTAASALRDLAAQFEKAAQLAESGKDAEAADAMNELFRQVRMLDIDSVEDIPVHPASVAFAESMFGNLADENTRAALQMFRMWGGQLMSLQDFVDAGRGDTAGRIAIETIRKIYQLFDASMRKIEETMPGVTVHVAPHDDCAVDALHAHGGIFDSLRKDRPIV